jgi:segregation and condensation protein A
MMENDAFEDIAAPTEGGAPAPFLVDIDGYEGPIDVLLALARDQKVDLAHISILQLADQYLAFVAEARRTNLELAADYLVMAAWLAYLKSRLLLPDMGGEDEPSGEEMAAALAFQLRRLEAMRNAGARLMARGRLGHDFFARGDPEAFAQVTTTVFEVSLYDLLKAYGEQSRRGQSQTLTIGPTDYYSVDDALVRFRHLLGSATDWESLWRYLPDTLGGSVVARSAVASTFAASLELAHEGLLTLRQSGTCGPIYLRACNRGDGGRS